MLTVTIYVTHSHQLSLNSELAYCATGKSSQWESIWVFSHFCKIKLYNSISVKLWCVCTDMLWKVREGFLRLASCYMWLLGGRQKDTHGAKPGVGGASPAASLPSDVRAASKGRSAELPLPPPHPASPPLATQIHTASPPTAQPPAPETCTERDVYNLQRKEIKKTEWKAERKKVVKLWHFGTSDKTNRSSAFQTDKHYDRQQLNSFLFLRSVFRTFVPTVVFLLIFISPVEHLKQMW